jgi:hypothetical protein
MGLKQKGLDPQITGTEDQADDPQGGKNSVPIPGQSAFPPV